MSLKHRITKLEQPQNKGILDVAILQARGAGVARGDTAPMTGAELTDLWQRIFNRPPHSLALEVAEDTYNEWLRKFREQKGSIA